MFVFLSLFQHDYGVVLFDFWFGILGYFLVLVLFCFVRLFFILHSPVVALSEKVF